VRPRCVVAGCACRRANIVVGRELEAEHRQVKVQPRSWSAITNNKLGNGTGGLKFTVDEVNSQGQKSHTETLQKSDGTESPIEGGGEPPQTRSAKRVDDHTYEIVTKVNGKVVSTRKVVISPDGKTMTSTVKGTNARGQAFDNVEIYEKQ